MVTITTVPWLVPDLKLYNKGWNCFRPPISSCAPSLLLRKKTSFLLLPMAILLTRLLLELVLESLLCPESFRNTFPIDKHLLLIVLPDFPLLINMLFLHKSPLERLPMLFRPPITSIPPLPILSLYRPSEMS